METTEAIRRRRSVHAYDTAKKITDEQLQHLFALVSHSPSSYNLQPWEFIVVRDTANKKRLRVCAFDQKIVEDASATIIVLAKLTPLDDAERVFSDWVAKGYFTEAHKQRAFNDVNILQRDPQQVRDFAFRSSCLAAMTLMLAAEDMGLVTCPIEGFSAEAVQNECSIPPTRIPVMLIALGYADPAKLPRQRLSRKAFSEIVFFEKYRESL